MFLGSHKWYPAALGAAVAGHLDILDWRLLNAESVSYFT